MTVLKTLLQTVQDEIKENLPEGIAESEVIILPEGKVPGSIGQRALVIYPISTTALTPNKLTRKKRISFRVAVVQRVRDQPNDRFDDICYMEKFPMAQLLEDIEPIIESNEMFSAFKTAMDVHKILPSNTDPPYDPESPPVGLPSRYSITDSFSHISTNYDPEHLYPSDFLTRKGNDKEQLYDKVAGFRMSSLYDSPIYVETEGGLECDKKDISDLLTSSSSSSSS